MTAFFAFILAVVALLVLPRTDFGFPASRSEVLLHLLTVAIIGMATWSVAATIYWELGYVRWVASSVRVTILFLGGLGLLALLGYCGGVF